MNPEITTVILQFVAMLILLIANGFFVSVEFAYVTVPRPRIDQLAAKGNPAATRVQHLLADTDRVLAASQIGVTIASLGLGWMGENLAGELIRIAFTFSGNPALANGIAHGVGLAIAFAFITSAHVVFGEQAPKIVALQSADRFALFSVRAVALVDLLLRPIVALLDNATSVIVRLLGVQPVGAHQTVYSVDELKPLIAETQQSGTLEPREKEMLHIARRDCGAPSLNYLSNVPLASGIRHLFLPGSFRLEREGRTIHFPTRKVESLLAFLALHPEEHYTRYSIWGA